MKCLIFLLLSFAYSDITNDSLSVIIKDEVARVLNEVVYIDPLEGKIGGIEINPLYSLVYSDNGLSFSGTLSIFPKNKNAEIAFPFAYLSQNDDELELADFKATFRMDAQYRFFLEKHRKGIHFLTSLRYARFIDDREYEMNSSGIEVVDYNYENRFGFAFGAGYRIFAQNGFYWGTSFYLGRYIATENDSIFANFEFFKLGMAF
tara:strand:- start:2692 stop:3306 length:615 start_codon:yes stop_codon:yes gene_type:complete